MPAIYFTPEELPHQIRLPKARLYNHKFRKLTALEPVGRYFASDPRKFCIIWKCICECGNYHEAQARHLVHGDVTNCGCAREWHGESPYGRATKIFKAYQAMKQRCFNPKCAAYGDYGGRGITVAPKWKNSFIAFLKDVGYPPSPYHSLDRFPDNNGNYEPGNVRWATTKQQACNKRTSRYLTIDHARKTVTEWGRETGKSPLTITTRLKLGWSERDAVMRPVKPYKPRSHSPCLPRAITVKT